MRSASSMYVPRHSVQAVLRAGLRVALLRVGPGATAQGWQDGIAMKAVLAGPSSSSSSTTGEVLDGCVAWKRTLRRLLARQEQAKERGGGQQRLGVTTPFFHHPLVVFLRAGHLDRLIRHVLPKPLPLVFAPTRVPVVVWDVCSVLVEAVQNGHLESAEAFLCGDDGDDNRDYDDASGGADRWEIFGMLECREVILSALLPQFELNTGQHNLGMETHVQDLLAACIAADWEWGVRYLLDAVEEVIKMQDLWPVRKDHVLFERERYGGQCILAAAASGSGTKAVWWMDQLARQFGVQSMSGRAAMGFVKSALGLRVSLLDNVVASPCTPEALDWLHEHGATASSRALYLAACAGQLGVMEWLHAKGGRACSDVGSTWVLAGAASSGNCALLDWLQRRAPQALQRERVLAELTREAASAAQLSALEWVASHDVTTFTSETATIVASAGAPGRQRVAVLDYLFRKFGVLPSQLHTRHFCDCEEEIRWYWNVAHMYHHSNVYSLVPAAEQGHVSVLEFMHRTGATAGVFEGGDTQAAQLWRTGIANACMYGHLHVLEFLHGTCGIEIGANAAPATCLREENIHVADYLRRHSCPSGSGCGDDYAGKFRMREMAHSGSILAVEFACAARKDCAEVSELLHALEVAAACGALPIVRHLRRRFDALGMRAWVYDCAMRAAVQARQFRTMRFLHEHCNATIEFTRLATQDPEQYLEPANSLHRSLVGALRILRYGLEHDAV